MKKILTLAASLMVVTATAASAGGVNIGWGNCFLGAGTSSLTNACALSTGSAGTAWVSVVPSVPMTQVVSATAVVDIQAGTPTTPAWWAVQPGGCRGGAVAMDFAATFDAIDCLSVFQATTDTNIPPALNSSVIGVANVLAGVGGPNRIRLISIGSVQPTLAATVDNVSEYAVVKLALSRVKSTGGTACAGCNVGAAIVVNEIKLQQPLGQGDQRVVNAADRQGVTYESSAVGAVPAPSIGATPAQNRTWGAVKSLYR